jgi:hypothetical protein
MEIFFAATFRPGLAAVMPEILRDDSDLRAAFDTLEKTMNRSCDRAKFAA